MHHRLAILLLILLPATASAQSQPIGNRFEQKDKFRQLEELLPTPTEARLASGAPGPAYWQQKVDYEIDVRLDDEDQRIVGFEKITYHNRSPHSLRYLWVHLDGNIFAPDSDAAKTASPPEFKNMAPKQMLGILTRLRFDGAFKITTVRDANRKPLPHTIAKTMMRIDLPRPLEARQSIQFSINWHYQINNSKLVGGRTGCEWFRDGNWIYEMAQWFPRMVAYTDVRGWHNTQYLGRGEFTLEYGDYTVRITAPEDHRVTATGVLQNPDKVLTATQLERLKKARNAKKPQFIVTPAEALANEKHKPSGEKTWVFKARQVRDFAWASSRKFIWDAQGVKIGRRTVMAMSLYPKEAEPLWSKYSTHAIIHALQVYSRYTVDYPYPVAISVNGPVGGMEYPMICFNGPRPQKDGTYPPGTKHGLISVIIHEVGHNYFPMIINSDERQWTWMDEGLNTFVQSIAEREWQRKYPQRRGEAHRIIDYMKSDRQVPIMTNSESIQQFGNNAYGKVAAALNILRETVMGRRLFDFAFKEYARRWQFKRPMPADFFRTMEDASGIDLDWFWRGWFYGTQHCDIAIERVRLHTLYSGDPDAKRKLDQADRAKMPKTLTQLRNEQMCRRIDDHPELKDFYNSHDKTKVTPEQRKKHQAFVRRLTKRQKGLLTLKTLFYVIELRNIGGLVMPVIIEVEFEDGTRRTRRIPAEIWRKDNLRAQTMLATEKPIRRLRLDPRLETADVDTENNHWPRRPVESHFRLIKAEKKKASNPMQRAREKDKKSKATKPVNKSKATKPAKNERR